MIILYECNKLNENKLVISKSIVNIVPPSNPGLQIGARWRLSFLSLAYISYLTDAS
jgi:hypothetical protein